LIPVYVPAVAFIYWDVRPEVFQVGAFAVRWYGMFFALLFAIGYFIGRWQLRSEGKSLESLDSLLVYLVAGTIIGARLGHCFFYEAAYYLRHPLEIFAVWQGGLASHGGAIGVLIAVYAFSRRHPDQPFLWLMDRIVVPTALGGCLIRLGNLFNSEILGEPTRVPWAFVFKRVDSVPRHPAQLYESIAYLIIFVCLMLVYRKLRAQTPRGLLLGLFLILVFTARFFIEFVKERHAAFEQNWPLSVGQILSIPFILAGVILVRRAKKNTPTNSDCRRRGDESITL
jgi:prolipoprotein diacylglyceryl transferase